MRPNCTATLLVDDDRVRVTRFEFAPGAETGLIAYLWPLFIVLFSGLLPGERLRPLHLVGAAVAFAGAALIVAG